MTATSSVEQVSAGRQSAGTLRLLLVEDDDVDAYNIACLVDERMGDDVDLERVRRVDDAVASATTSPPDVILLDLTLPDATGLSGLARLLDLGVAPIVVQTGRDDVVLAEDALMMGAQDFLTKNAMTADVVCRSIRYALARHRKLGGPGERHDVGARDVAPTWRERRYELDDFAHVVAHDLRAPVRTARLLADRLVAASKEGSPLTDELADRLDQTLERMDSLIVSLLEYSGLRGAAPGRSTVSVAEAANEVVAALHADIDERGATITVDADVFANADSELLRRVFQNLFVNSLKYARPGVAPDIEVVGRVEGDAVRVQVRDNGVGVPVVDRHRAFDLLERLHPDSAPGLGFGLAICRRIVDALDGTIWIEPWDGPGTTVTFELPAAEPDLEIVL